MLQALGLSVSAAAALQSQLAEAGTQAQAAAAEIATLLRRLDTEAAAMAGQRQQLEAEQGRAEADAETARAELDILRAQVHLAESRLRVLQ